MKTDTTVYNEGEMKQRESFITRRLTVVEISIGSDNEDNVQHHYHHRCRRHHHHRWQKHKKQRYKPSKIRHYVTGTFSSSTAPSEHQGTAETSETPLQEPQTWWCSFSCRNMKTKYTSDKTWPDKCFMPYMYIL
jgi:hypothetical protein